MGATMKPERKNFWLGVLHEGFWGTGFGFLTPITIVPLALVDLGQPALVVGIFTAFFFAGMNLPQAFSALGLPPRFTDPKPLAWLHVPAVLGPLVAGLGFLLLPPGPAIWRLVFLFSGFTLFALGIGMVVPHWVAFIGRAIPEEGRGRYFGTSFSASYLCATLTGWLASRWADQGALHWGYTLCFLASVPFLAASLLVLTRMKPLAPRPEPPPSQALRNSLRLIKNKLAEPGPFRVFVFLVVLLIFTASSGSLFTIYLREAAHVETSWFQFFTPAMNLGTMAGALVLGYLADNRGVRTAYQAAYLAGLSGLALVFLFNNQILYVAAFFCLGSLIAAFMVINSVAILKIAGQRESSIQTGIFNTLLTPFNILAPVSAGWLAGFAGYGWSFSISAACALAALGILATHKEWGLKMPNDRTGDLSGPMDSAKLSDEFQEKDNP
jgi:MFS family permease